MSDDIRWIRSYVLEEPDGRVGTVCIYQATSPEAIREHASRAGLAADEIIPVGDTVVIREDPAPPPPGSSDTHVTWRARARHPLAAAASESAERANGCQRAVSGRQ